MRIVRRVREARINRLKFAQKLLKVFQILRLCGSKFLELTLTQVFVLRTSQTEGALLSHDNTHYSEMYIRAMETKSLNCVIFAARCYPSAACAIMRCPSVRMSFRPSRSWILSKRINISSNFFSPSRSRNFSFSIPNVMAIFWPGLP